MPEEKAEKKVPEALKIYEDGKQRRYALLFAVNGGTFAIAKELYGPSPPSLGLLSPWLLSVGMIAFTILMVCDIWSFAMKMRKDYSLDVFQDKKVGQILLVFIGMLICGGWGLAALPPTSGTRVHLEIRQPSQLTAPRIPSRKREFSTILEKKAE